MPHDVRREQLVRAGLELLGRRPYDQVSIGEIAAAAGISKGLLYHYFPTKTDFVAAVLVASRDELTRLLSAVAALPPAERLSESLATFLDYAEDHAAGYLAVARARGGANVAIRAVLKEGRRERVRALVRLAAALADVPPEELLAPVLESALEGWLAFTDAVVVRWLERGDLTRREAHLLLEAGLLGALESAGAADPRPAFARLSEAAAELRARRALAPSATP